MADISGPKKDEGDDAAASLPVPETTKLSGCTATAGIIVAILVLLVVVAFGLFVGACWR